MLVAVASVKGAPGVTRLAMTLTALWPGEASAVLLEVDPAGGTIAARFGLEASPSLTTLAAAAYPTADNLRLSDHTQELPGGLSVVVAPADPASVRAAVADLATPNGLLEQMAAEPDSVLIADCGRLDSAWVSPVLVAADAVLLVTRPRPEEIGPLDAVLKVLRSAGSHVRLVLRGGGYEAEELSRPLGVDVTGYLPEVPNTGLFSRGRRAAYARSVLRIALSLADKRPQREDVIPEMAP